MQDRGAVIVTFDEDLADQRLFPLEEGEHAGVVRLLVWPTTAEETRSALDRLLEHAEEDELRTALVIEGNRKIRIREP